MEVNDVCHVMDLAEVKVNVLVNVLVVEVKTWLMNEMVTY